MGPINNHANSLMSDEIIALDSDIDDGRIIFQSIIYVLLDLTQIELKQMSFVRQEDSHQAHIVLGGFMASQSENRKDTDLPEPFVNSDEDLSDLECFISIKDLLLKGGDYKRRVEFILDQFQKASVEASGPTGGGVSKFPKPGRQLGLKKNKR